MNRLEEEIEHRAKIAEEKTLADVMHKFMAPEKEIAKSAGTFIQIAF